MTPEERELRRALESRSEEVSPEFRARLSTALAEGRPASNLLPALAAVAAVVLVFATVGVLLLARQARNQPPPVAASTPSASATPTSSPVAGVLTKPPQPIALPANAQLSAPSSSVVWTLMVNQYLYRSNDRGATWEQRPIVGPDDGGAQILEMSFVNDQEGWLTVGGARPADSNPCMTYSANVYDATNVWHTTDAGATWRLLPSTGLGQSQCRNGLSFVDSKHGFVVGWNPNQPTVIYRTTDGGLTWAASAPLPYPPGYKREVGGISVQAGPVRAFGSTLLVPVAGRPAPGISIEYTFSSTDGGATWAYLAKAPLAGIPVAFVTANRWLQLVNSGESMETTDAGATWHRYATAYSDAAPIAADVIFGDSQGGYATVRGGISRTADGGLHWTLIASPGTGIKPTG